jgi:hypothetical protein
MNIYITSVLVYAGLFVVGFLMSLLVSFLKCSKISPSSSAKEGAIFAVLPAVLYYVANEFAFIRNIFSSTLESTFGVKPENSAVMGVGYLMMLGSWIMTTRLIDTIETDVCKPSLDELKKFQDDLAKELKEKQEKEEADKKPTS